MIRVKLTSILVNDQARARQFYTNVLGFRIQHDIPLGEAAWLTLVAPDESGGSRAAAGSVQGRDPADAALHR